jgi:hypothetical protein
MKKSEDTTQTETPTAPVGTSETPATKPVEKAKAVKEPKVEKAAKSAKPAKAAKADADGETTDRFSASVKELKETKGGFVAYHFLTGKDRDAIAKELWYAFKLPDAQARKITRRITGRVRLYQRVFELLPAKEA